MSTQPPGVTSVPAKCTATVTSREVDVPPGPAISEPVLRSGPAVTLLRERMPAVASSTAIYIYLFKKYLRPTAHIHQETLNSRSEYKV